MKMRIKATGEIGYLIKEDGDMVYLRVPADNGWPFPHYVYVKRKDVTLVREKEDLSDIEEALF